MISRIVAAGCLIAALAGQGARAAEGGYSNYVPGTYGDFGMALAPTENWTLRNDFYFYDASASWSVLSGDIVVGVDLEFLMNFTTVVFKPGVELFGAQYATGIFVPVVDLDLGASLSGGDPSVSVGDGTSGLGDVALIPIALYWSREKIHTSFSQSIVVPSGDYDIDNPINTGLNHWSFDTNFALTHLNPETGRDFFFVIGHIYNTENDDTDYQTGQELHLDIAFNQFFSETFGAGLRASTWSRSRAIAAAGRCWAISRPRRRGSGRRCCGPGISAIRRYPLSPSGCTSSRPRTGWRATTCSQSRHGLVAGRLVTSPEVVVRCGSLFSRDHAQLLSQEKRHDKHNRMAAGVRFALGGAHVAGYSPGAGRRNT